MIAVSRVIREVVDGVSTMRVETTTCDAPNVAPPSVLSPLAGAVRLEWGHGRGWDPNDRRLVLEEDVYTAPDGTRWTTTHDGLGRVAGFEREPADLAAALRRREVARSMGAENDVLPLVSAPPSPAGVIESLLDPVTREHDPGEADYDAVTAIDPDADLEIVAEASAVMRRLAGRKKKRIADAEHARRAAREVAAETEEKRRTREARARAATRSATLTDDEAGEIDVGGFRLTNPTREDVMNARKKKKAKT